MMRLHAATIFISAAVLALVAASAFIPLTQSESESSEYDAVISQTGASTVVTYNTQEPFSIQYSSGSDITVFDFGSVQGSLKIALDGANVGNLTLFNVDSPDDIYRTLNLDFVMLSGSVKKLSLISVDKSVASSLDTSYERAYTLFRSVSMAFVSGTVTEISPTSDMVGVSSISYDFGYGFTADRFYITGINGKYTSAYAEVNGATLGYMSNISSRVGSLEYNIRSGQVSYLCLGANTEHRQSSELESKSTFLATGDVKVHIGPAAEISRCILGAGILNIPSIICNGEIFDESIVHNVTIDAPNIKVENDSVFYYNDRYFVCALSSYQLDRFVSSAKLSDSCTYGRTTIDVYGPDGIWASPSIAKVTSGVSLFVNADLVVSSESYVTVQEGGYLSNSGFIDLFGNLYNYGRLDNSGVIQCSKDSVLFGTIGGSGPVSDAVYYVGESESLGVMVSRSAASIILEEPAEVSSIKALIEGGYKSVTVSTGSQHGIIGDRFVLGISPASVPEAFQHAYRLSVIGVDSEALSDSTVRVVLDTDPSKCTAVYVDNGNGYDVIGSCEYESSISFDTGGKMVFYTLTYESENPPVPVTPSHFKILDYVLCALIVALGITILYVLFRMRRKSDA